MRCLKWILTSLAAAFPLNAAAAIPTLPAATAFYRSPASPFVSGQTTRSKLELSRRRSEFESSHRVRWNGKEFLLKGDALLRDVHCWSKASLAENSQLHENARADALTTGELSRGHIVEILETKEDWARVKGTKLSGWLPLSRLSGRGDDPGVFVALVDSFLRERPTNQALIRTTIPRRTRLKALSMEPGGWIRVSHGNREGYVDANHLAGRADFAIWAWTKTGPWTLVSHREGTTLKTRDGKSLPLADITAWGPNPTTSLVTPTADHQPPLGARAEILKTESTLWGVSVLPGHGEVYWRQNSQVSDAAKVNGEALTTAELLRRDVYSYALTGTKNIQGLVAARGIWHTTDGLTWKRLNMFGEQDLPVALRTENDWFVGAYRSKDKGKTFEPFIRWDALTKAIETHLLRPPRYVKLQKIEPLTSTQIKVTFDTGVRRIALKAHLENNIWTATK